MTRGGAHFPPADRAALMTRAHQRDVDKDALTHAWTVQAAELRFSAEAVASTDSATPASKHQDA